MIDPQGEKAEVTIVTDEKNKTGQVIVKTSFAIWTKDGKISKEAMAQAQKDIKKKIEEKWKGQFNRDGIKFTLTTEVTSVKIYQSKEEAMGSGAMNVYEMVDGPVTSKGLFSPAAAATTNWNLGSGPDTGRWDINADYILGHEFTHMLGVDDHSGRVLSNPDSTRGSPTLEDADFGWAFGGEISSHRRVPDPNRELGRGPQYQQDTIGHTSTRILGAPAGPWWR